MNVRLRIIVEDDDGLLFERLVKTIGKTILATTISRITIITSIFNPGLDRKLIEVDFLKDDS